MRRDKKFLHKTALFALTISFLLLICKFAAYFITGSKAVLSDAMESIINTVTGTFMLISITISTQPADDNHPYGHGKIEAFSAGLEGGLIILAGMVILMESIPGLFSRVTPRRLDIGILLLFGAGVINMALGLYLLRIGGKVKSDALLADGRHLLTDFYTSAGIVLGLAAVRLTSWSWLDPLIACLVAVAILIPGAGLVKKAIKNLMNEADPDTLGRIVAALNDIKAKALLCPHQLRVIRSGGYHHIDLHIVLPSFWPLEKANKAADKVEHTLLTAMGGAGDVMIHIDPCTPSCCPCCNISRCPLRTHKFTNIHSWPIENVTASHHKCLYGQ